MQDLSALARDSMWVTSQAGGNMTGSNAGAMTAPGSQPVDVLSDRDVQSEPKVEVGPPRPPGNDGKPKARTTAGKPDLPEPSWKTAS